MVFQAMLELLNENKRLPYYAAERRIDLFINFFIEDILTAYYGEEVKFIAPEFPLKVLKNNQAKKLDYLCMFKNTKQPIFVELKTDVLSFKSDQAGFYVEKASNWSGCIDQLKQIIVNGNMRFTYREKYWELLKILLNEGLVDVKDEKSGIINRQATLPRNTRAEKGAFSRELIKLTECLYVKAEKEARLLYLIPSDDDLKHKINNACREKADILDFQKLPSLEISSDFEYHDEFVNLIRFLKNL